MRWYVFVTVIASFCAEPDRHELPSGSRSPENIHCSIRLSSCRYGPGTDRDMERPPFRAEGTSFGVPPPPPPRGGPQPQYPGPPPPPPPVSAKPSVTPGTLLINEVQNVCTSKTNYIGVEVYHFGYDEY